MVKIGKLGALEKIALTIFMILGMMFAALYAVVLVKYGDYNAYPINEIVTVLMGVIVVQGLIGIYLILTQNSDLITMVLDRGFKELEKREKE